MQDDETTYTRADLDATIAHVRSLAPRAGAYKAAEHAPVQGLSGWLAITYFLKGDGSDAVREDGTRVTPYSTACGSEGEAIRRATEANIDMIDKIKRPQWFTKGGSRNLRYPREKSPALSEARQAQFHASAAYQRFAECFND